MASVLFSTIGQAVGGPLAATVGATVGTAVDSVLFGGRARNAAELFVQRSAYGDALPRLYGRTRVAGQLIWALPLEGAQGKGSGRRVSGSSFAIALSSGPIKEVGRIWADGREIRNGAGDFESRTEMRVHMGALELQPDPLIAAAEGVGTVPGYAGVAYVVFENFDLSSFGNRIPNLSFEVIADEMRAADWLREEATRGGISAGPGQGDPAATGYAALGEGRNECGRLARLSDFSLSYADGEARFTGSPRSFDIARTELLGAGDGMELVQGNRPGAMAVGYMDADRDFQPGRQRVARARRGLEVESDVAMAASAGGALMLAGRLLRQSEAAADRISFALPWRWLQLAVGDIVNLEGAGRWRIVERDVRGLLIYCGAERAWNTEVWPAVSSDSGRNLPAPMLPTPPTDLQLFETPIPLVPGRKAAWVWMGGGAGWRGAVASLLTAGEQQDVGEMRSPVSWGRLRAPVDVGPENMWDRRNTLLVEVDREVPLFESRSEADVLAGANLVRLGDELLQYCEAEPLGDNLVRLSGLLRGQFGTGFRMRTVDAGAVVRLISPGRLLPIDLPMDSRGRSLLVLASGRGDPVGGTEASLALEGMADSPMAPAHVRVVRDREGAIECSWLPRSAELWAWDSTEAPALDFVWRFESADGRRVSRFVHGLEATVSVEDQIVLLGAPFGAGRVLLESSGNGPLDLRTSAPVHI